MASIDLIKASNGAGDAVQATVASARVIGSTTLKVNDVTNFPGGQFIGTTGTIDNNGVFDPATLTVFTAHLSGADVEIDTIAPGYADLGNTNGQVLVIKPNTLWADNVADTLAVSHNVDGTLKNNIVTTAKIADSSVTTDKIANAAVTADNIDFTTFKNYFFSCYLTSDWNPSGGGEQNVMITGATKVSDAENKLSSTGVFTAPENGVYSFTGAVYKAGNGVIVGVKIGTRNHWCNTQEGGTGGRRYSAAVVSYMKAGEQAQLQVSFDANPNILRGQGTTWFTGSKVA